MNGEGRRGREEIGKKKRTMKVSIDDQDVTNSASTWSVSLNLENCKGIINKTELEVIHQKRVRNMTVHRITFQMYKYSSN